MTNNRMILLKNIYDQVVQVTDLNERVQLLDFNNNKLDYQYLHSKGFIGLVTTSSSVSAYITPEGMDVVEDGRVFEA